MLISKATWDKLSEKDKRLFNKPQLDSVATQREAWDKLEQESEKKLKEAGVKFTEVKDHNSLERSR